jgi:prevent-host-death family protein
LREEKRRDGAGYRSEIVKNTLTFRPEYHIIQALEKTMAINLKNDIKPVSYIKNNAAEMMKYVNERKNPIVITQNGEARAVLVDIETYQETQDAFALINLIKIAEKDIRDGNVEPADKVFAELRKEIGEDGRENRKV